MLPRKSNVRPTVSRFLADDWNNLFDWNNRNYAATSTTLPSVNIKETDDYYLVEVAAPGMKKDDFQVELHNNVLTINSSVENEKKEQNGETYTRREFSFQSFQRSFNLDNNVVDDTNIKATYKDGILSLALPKKEEAKKKPARFIKIS